MLKSLGKTYDINITEKDTPLQLSAMDCSLYLSGSCIIYGLCGYCMGYPTGLLYFSYSASVARLHKVGLLLAPLFATVNFIHGFFFFPTCVHYSVDDLKNSISNNIRYP